MGQDNQVAVFIDYDNIEISVEEAFGKTVEVDWNRIFQAATQMGRVVMRRAYADWAEAAAKQKREIETMQAREQAETIKVQSEEHMRSELARLKAEGVV